jgi:predicted permease
MPRRLFRLPLFSRKRVDAEMREEIEAHVALGVDELVQRGVSPNDAERTVRARFGNLDAQLPILVASAQRRTRQTGRRELLGNFSRDIAFGFRQLRRAPALTAGVVLCLAFGIGASATVFSWMEGLVLRPLPAVRDVDHLITIRPEVRNGFGVSLAEFDEWRAQGKSVGGMTAASLSLFSLHTGTGAEERARPLYGMFVSASYFDVLGVKRGLGRFFITGEDAPGSTPVAVISHTLWRDAFSAVPDILGRTVRVNGQPVRVVGVAPEHFGGNLAAAHFDVWLPISSRPYFVPSDAADWRRRDHRWLDVIARLKPGVSVTQAHAEFQAIGKWQASTYPESRGREVRAIPLDVGSAKQLQPLLASLVVITGLVILLICSNIANLLLARAAARYQELAVRLSLGATRARLVSQLMTESLLLALFGAALGTILAVYGHRLLALLMPSSSVTLGAQAGIDFRFLLFVVAVTGGSVLAFGLAPALVGTRLDLAETLKNGARGSSATRSRVRTTLVVAQFSFALSALVCAALFLRRDRDVRAMDRGFRDPEHVLLIQTEMSTAGYRDPRAWQRTIDLATERVAQLAGVQSATVGTFVPLGFVGYFRHPVEVPGYRTESDVPDRVLVNGVGPGYFDIMRIPVVEGRTFRDDDIPGRPDAAVVNEAFAGQFFKGQEPLGRSITLGGRAMTIVGVVKNGKYDYRAIDDPDAPFVYYAWKQWPSNFVTMHVRTTGDPVALASAVREAILGVEPGMTLLAPVTLAEYASVPFFPSRSALIVLTILGSAALVLASMGLFSVISYGVALRTREIGIRVALGATRQQIIALFVRASLSLVVRGMVIGVLAAVLFSTALRSRLPRLPAGALPEFAIPALVLAFSALAAGLVPARRAASIDPARTLRTE